MKKIIYAIFISLVLFSCGKDKKSETEKPLNDDEYVVALDVILEKDDTCMLFVYDENGNEMLDKRVKTDVKGSPSSQIVTLKLPVGISPVNLGVGFSSNKDQQFITLKSITIKNKNKVLVRPDNYLTFFANNDCLVMDMATFKHALKHDKDYPPGFVGNDALKALLSK